MSSPCDPWGPHSLASSRSGWTTEGPPCRLLAERHRKPPGLNLKPALVFSLVKWDAPASLSKGEVFSMCAPHIAHRPALSPAPRCGSCRASTDTDVAWPTVSYVVLRLWGESEGELTALHTTDVSRESLSFLAGRPPDLGVQHPSRKISG